MKATLLSFSVDEIHYRDIAYAKSSEERNKYFGIQSIHTLFVVC